MLASGKLEGGMVTDSGHQPASAGTSQKKTLNSDHKGPHHKVKLKLKSVLFCADSGSGRVKGCDR